MPSRRTKRLVRISATPPKPDASAAQEKGVADGLSAQFAGRSYIEIQKSAGALDLDHDFTIEMWAKWQRPDAWDVFAGDEAWPSMSSEVPVVGGAGLDASEAASGQRKGSLTSPLAATAPGWA